MTKKTAVKKGTPDAMLREDHKKVKQLFRDFEAAETNAEKKSIVEEAIFELRVHTTVEEELVYPAIRALDESDEELMVEMDEAEEEHAAVERLMDQLDEMEPGDSHYDAKFIVLSEFVKHHIEEEESDMFPENKEVLKDETLGKRMAERKSQLMKEVPQVARR